MRKTAIVSAMAASMMMSGLAGTSIMAAGPALDGPPPPKRRRSIVAPRPSYSGHIDPSRYMPHIGTKERARHAGRPDGAMHSPGPIHKANLVAAVINNGVPIKPKRARKAVAS